MTPADNGACCQKAPITMSTSNKMILSIQGIKDITQQREEAPNPEVKHNVQFSELPMGTDSLQSNFPFKLHFINHVIP